MHAMTLILKHSYATGTSIPHQICFLTSFINQYRTETENSSFSYQIKCSFRTLTHAYAGKQPLMQIGNIGICLKIDERHTNIPTIITVTVCRSDSRQKFRSNLKFQTYNFKPKNFEHD